jgi:hypothetical protein
MRFFPVLPIIASVFLPRFAFSFAQRLLIIGPSLVGLVIFGRLRVHIPRLILFALSIAAMTTATVFGGIGRVSFVQLAGSHD